MPRAFAAPVAPAAPAAPLAPQVVENCNGQDGVSASVQSGGRRQVVICARAIRGKALDGLRGARERIARDPGLTEDIRRQVLADLDEEIESQAADKDDDADE